jgi:hypothetical protein
MRLFLILFLVATTLIGCSNSKEDSVEYYTSLEKAIEVLWETEISILMDNSTNMFIIFTDDKQNMTMNTYSKSDNGYQYSSDGETSFQFESKIEELEFVFNTNLR